MLAAQEEILRVRCELKDSPQFVMGGVHAGFILSYY
jgi:hypothetical protein